MSYFRLTLMVALALGLAFGGSFGCDNEPPETARRVVMEDDDDSADTEEATEAQDAAEAEEAEEATAEEEAVETEEATSEEEATEEEEATSEEEAAEATEEEAEEEEAVAEETVYLIEPNPESFIQFTGYQALKSQEGFFNVFEGSITVNGDDLESAEVEVTIEMDSLATRSNMLTKVLKDEDFFYIEEYPESTFVSSRIEKEDEEDAYLIHGALTMRGEEKRLGIPVVMTLDDNGLFMESELVIDRYNWGIEKEGYLDEAINEEVLIEFEILAEPQS